MALKGTLKDLGIADIFQLLGQQAKSGVLLLRSAAGEVKVHLASAAVTRVESSTREERARLGQQLVMGEVVPAAAVQAALARQVAEGKRLGDMLVDAGLVDRATVNEFVRLQATETLARLFLWKDGTYEFTQTKHPEQPGPEDPGPVRSEGVLMNGFRLLDDWAVFQRTFPSMDMTLEVLKPLPVGEAHAGGEGDPLAGLDAALDSMESGFGDSPNGGVPDEDRLLHSLVHPERNLRELGALSRLGELGVCRSALALIQGGYLRAVPVPGMEWPAASAPTVPAPGVATGQGRDETVDLEDMFGDATVPHPGPPAGASGAQLLVPAPVPELTVPAPSPMAEVAALSDELEPHSAEMTRELRVRPRQPAWKRAAGGMARVLGWGVALVAVLALAWVGGLSARVEREPGQVTVPAPDELQAQVGRLAEARLVRALEVYRLRTGQYPERLEQLTEQRLVQEPDLRGPFQRSFAYARRADRYILTRPFY